MPQPRAGSRLEEVPWCADLLSQPGVVTFVPSSRAPQEAPLGMIPTQDQLFRKLLRAPDAIPECIGFYKDTHVSHPDNPDKISTSHSSDSNKQLHIQSSSLIFDLQPGVNGFNGTAHGGLVAAIIDEAMGNFLLINSAVQQREKRAGPLPPNLLDLDSVGGFMTAGMNMVLKKTIATPQVVVVTAVLDKIEGKKMLLRVTVEGKDGAEYARCDGLWISFPKHKL
ncbi:hypothetical protein GQ53DRAFT_664659 [Thozetella sp. PMI_491]|nr:hypothetical protein GQ53DRAFT_664659 [Thozetella sp. PMI_491]